MNRPDERDETFDLLRDLPVEVSVEQVSAFVATLTLAPTAAFWASKINLNTFLMTSAGASIIAGSIYLLSPNDPGEPAQHQALPAAPALEEPMATPEPEPLAAVPFTLPVKQDEVAAAKEPAPLRTDPLVPAPIAPAPSPLPQAPVAMAALPPPMGRFAVDGTSREFDLTGFDRVTLLGSAEVLVKQGPFSVKAEGDKDLLDQLVVSISGKTLSIGAPGSSCDRSPMDQLVVHVQMPSLELVSLNGSGDVIIDDFRVDGPMGLVLRGSGDVAADGLKGVSHMTVELTGSGDVVSERTEVAGKTTITLLGSGDVRMSGRTETLEVTLRGSGDVVADALNANDCDVHVFGSGDVRVDCARSMRSETMGSGSVNNSGSARGAGTRSESNSN